MKQIIKDLSKSMILIIKIHNHKNQFKDQKVINYLFL